MTSDQCENQSLFPSRRAGERARARGRTARLAIVLGVALACAPVAAQDAGKFPPEQIGRGSALYKTHCEQCHGVRMMGAPWGIELSTFPRDNPARFVDSVTYGIRAMPPWGDLLKPDEIQALWAYLVAGEPKQQ